MNRLPAAPIVSARLMLSSVLFVLAVSAFGVSAVFAQATVQASTPANGETVPAGLTTITITFTAPINVDQSAAQLEAAGQSKLLAVTTSVDRSDRKRMTIQTDPLPDGNYTVRWQVVDDANEPARGQIDFVVGNRPTSAQPVASEAGQQAVTSTLAAGGVSSARGSDGGLTWILLAVILVLAVVAVVQAVSLRRRSGTRG